MKVTNGRVVGERSESRQSVGVGQKVNDRPQGLLGHCKNCGFNLRDKRSQWKV